MKRGAIIGAGIALLVIGGVAFAVSLSHTHMGHGPTGHGLHQHDEATMPGLIGENASASESAEIALLFRNFDTITREVEYLANGIRTLTHSSDAAVMDAIISHSIGMIDRVDQADDPKIRIQSPTLDIFFTHGSEIKSEIDITDAGLVVIQTSENPEIVTALHTHAAEVTDMADRGMAAVHEMMMEQGRGH